VGGCNDPVCNGAREAGPPVAWGADCNGNGRGQVEGGGAIARYVPEQAPEDFDVGIFTGNGEIHGCNGHAVCILTISFEAKGGHATYGNSSPLGTTPSWQKGTVAYGISLGYQSTGGGQAGFNIGGSFPIYDGQIEGKLYNDGSGPATGYVGAWEYGSNCVTSSRAVRDAVYWTYPRGVAVPDTVREEVRGWYRD
jgi:hypothetical protein